MKAEYKGVCVCVDGKKENKTKKFEVIDDVRSDNFFPLYPSIDPHEDHKEEKESEEEK